jgi:fumarate hydratase class II
MTAVRVEQDGLGPVNLPYRKLGDTQTQRPLEHFSIGDDLFPRRDDPCLSGCAVGPILKSVAGKVVVITGAARGIGRATALRLLKST